MSQSPVDYANSTSLTSFCFDAITPGANLALPLPAPLPAGFNSPAPDSTQRRVLPLVFWTVCAALHLAVICLYAVANYRHSLGTANGLKYVLAATHTAPMPRSRAQLPNRRAVVIRAVPPGTGSCSARCLSSPYAPQ